MVEIKKHLYFSIDLKSSFIVVMNYNLLTFFCGILRKYIERNHEVKENFLNVVFQNKYLMNFLEFICGFPS